MPTISQNLASFTGLATRRTTISKLLKAKTISFFGGVCLLINGMTGPGVPFTPATFQQSGWVFPTILFGMFALVSALSVLFIIEAMQAIPGNKHFQGTVEFATLINFYFGDMAHYFGQFLLYGALQSNAMQSIVLMAQTFDNILVDIFGKSCGLAISGPNAGWYCVSKISETYPSPFEDTWVLFTLGILLVLILSMPLGIVNLDDNIIAQIMAFWLSIAIGIEWIGASIYRGLDTRRVPAAGNDFAKVVGTIMLNLAFTTVVPSWVNIKKRTVNAQSVVWSAVAIACALYMLVGLFPALGFDLDESGSILPALMRTGKLNKASAYMFSIVMLLPSIPVNFIVAQNNLVQNKVAGKWTGIFVAHVLPWFMCIPLQTGQSMQQFINWTSLIFVSTANFIIPLVIYLKCLRFRREYNESRVLSPKQKLLLKEIHWSSRTIHKFIDDKTAHESNLAELGRRGLVRDRSELSMRGAIPPLEDDEVQPTISAAPNLQIPPISITIPDEEAKKQHVPVPSPASILKTPVSDEASSTRSSIKPLQEDGTCRPAPVLKKGSTVRFGDIDVYDSAPKQSVEESRTRMSVEPESGGSSQNPENYSAVRPSSDNETADDEEYLMDDVPDPDMEHKLARLETRAHWDVEGGGGVGGTLKRAMRLRRHGRTGSPVSGGRGGGYTRPGRAGAPSNIGTGADDGRGEHVRLERLNKDEGEESPAATKPGPETPVRRDTSGSNGTDMSDGADLIPRTLLPADLLRKETLPVHPQYVSPTFRSIPTWFPVRGRVVAIFLLVITGGVSLANIIIAIAEPSH